MGLGNLTTWGCGRYSTLWCGLYPQEVEVYTARVCGMNLPLYPPCPWGMGPIGGRLLYTRWWVIINWDLGLNPRSWACGIHPHEV